MKRFFNCPHCNSTRLTHGAFNVDSLEIWSTVSCTECFYEWDEVFAFTGNYDTISDLVLDEKGNEVK